MSEKKYKRVDKSTYDYECARTLFVVGWFISSLCASVGAISAWATFFAPVLMYGMVYCTTYKDLSYYVEKKT
jgi:hypothetical protein